MHIKNLLRITKGNNSHRNGPYPIHFSSPEPKANGELIVYQSSRRLSVCLSVCPSVHTFKHGYL